MSYRPQIKSNSSGTLTDLPLDAETIQGKSILDAVYPIGSIYMSVNSTSPATLFGGTWSQLKDKFLLGCGDTYSNGAIGGEATHTLSVNEMPSHRHILKYNGGELLQLLSPNNTEGAGFWADGYGSNTTGKTTGYALYTGSVGNTESHNNMPPYLAIYMWKRTA